MGYKIITKKTFIVVGKTTGFFEKLIYPSPVIKLLY